MFALKHCVAGFLLFSATLPANARGLQPLSYPNDPQVLVKACIGVSGSKNITPQCQNFRMIYQRELSLCMAERLGEAPTSRRTGRTVTTVSENASYKASYLICSTAASEMAVATLY